MRSSTVLRTSISLLLMNFLWSVSIVYRVSESDDHIVIHETNSSVYHEIPNKQIFDSLEFDADHIRSITKEQISKLSKGDDVPSTFIYQAGALPDDIMAPTIRKIFYMQPTEHYIVNTFYLPGIFNPTVIQIEGKILMVYGRRPHLRRNKLLFGWLNETTFNLDEKLSFYNISIDSIVADNDYNTVQDDGRLLLLHSSALDNTSKHKDNNIELLLTYGSGGKFSCRFSYVKITIPNSHNPFATGKVDGRNDQQHRHHNKQSSNKTTTMEAPNSDDNNPQTRRQRQQRRLNEEKVTQKAQSLSPIDSRTAAAQFGESIELRVAEGGLFQKNWVAFQYQNNLLFLETIHSMHIVELLPPLGNDIIGVHVGKDVDKIKNKDKQSATPNESEPDRKTKRQLSNEKSVNSAHLSPPTAVPALATKVSDVSSDVNLRVKTYHRETEKIKLPWRAKYGRLRGGTNAVLINTNPTHTTAEAAASGSSSNTNGSTKRKHSGGNGTTNGSGRIDSASTGVNVGVESQVYLSIFHTKVRFQEPHRLDTYFMGAMTQCSSPPFQIHTMSMYPIIVKGGLYDGAWVTNYIDYVVYPTGIYVDSKNSNHLVVSFGHQDKDAYITVFDITKLLNSLTFVGNCTHV